MSSHTTLILGDRTFKVGALTLDQLVEIVPLYEQLKDHSLGRGGFAVAVGIVKAALADQVPDGESLRATADQVLQAVADIAHVSGLVTVGEAMALMSAKATRSSTSSPTSVPTPDGAPMPSDA